MVVETREGNKYLVHNEKFIRKSSYNNLKDYNDDLTIRSPFKQLDIMKVYESDAKVLNELFDDDFLNLIWSRDEITVGDKVRVFNNNNCFKYYNEWVEKHIENIGTRYRYDIGQSIDNGVKCKVLCIDEHGLFDDKLAYVKHCETDRCYLISLKGLQKVCD